MDDAMIYDPEVVSDEEFEAHLRDLAEEKAFKTAHAAEVAEVEAWLDTLDV